MPSSRIPQTATQKLNVIREAERAGKQVFVTDRGELRQGTFFQRSTLWIKDHLPRPLVRRLLPSIAKYENLNSFKETVNYQVAMNFRHSLFEMASQQQRSVTKPRFVIPTDGRVEQASKKLISAAKSGQRIGTKLAQEAYNKALSTEEETKPQTKSQKVDRDDLLKEIREEVKTSNAKPEATKVRPEDSEEPASPPPPPAEDKPQDPVANQPSHISSLAEKQEQDLDDMLQASDEEEFAPLPSLDENEEESLPASIAATLHERSAAATPQSLKQEKIEDDDDDLPPPLNRPMADTDDEDDLPAPLAFTSEQRAAWNKDAQARKQERLQRAVENYTSQQTQSPSRPATPQSQLPPHVVRALADGRKFNVVGKTAQTDIERLQSGKTPYPGDAKDYYLEKQNRMFCGKHSLHAMFGQELVSESDWVARLTQQRLKIFGVVENIPPDLNPSSGASGADSIKVIADSLKKDGVISFPGKTYDEYIDARDLKNNNIVANLEKKLEDYEGDRMIVGSGWHFVALRRDDKGAWWMLDSMDYTQGAKRLNVQDLLPRDNYESLAFVTFGTKLNPSSAS